MIIEKLSYENKDTDWKLKEIDFEPLTLLVGASGVGKTRILKCLLNLKKISKGSAVNGAKWKVFFKTESGNSCIWEGEYENKGFSASGMFNFMPEKKKEKDEPKIEYEKISINGQVVADRENEEIFLEGNKTVKLSLNESLLSLLKEEDSIKEIHKEFSKIIFDDNSSHSVLSLLSIDDGIEEKKSEYLSLEDIRESEESIILKLYFTYVNQPDEFNKITEAFIDVFPYVEDLKVEPIHEGETKVPLFFRNTPLIQIKEKGVANWIDQTKMSSGMLRSLIHMAEIYLCHNASVILIDEFENSLGVNCIDELTASILNAGRGLQFIMTSHHPYIINHIHHRHWKIISRKSGAVTSFNSDKFKFGKSKHQAFTQLINLDLYTEGADS